MGIFLISTYLFTILLNINHASSKKSVSFSYFTFSSTETVIPDFSIIQRTALLNGTADAIYFHSKISAILFARWTLCSGIGNENSTKENHHVQ
jgi:hypothetical protein